jgi:hypothetical protein
MAPEFSPNIALLDIRYKHSLLLGRLTYYEKDKGRIGVRWLVDKPPGGYKAIGNGAAYITDDTDIQTSSSENYEVMRISEDQERYQWSEAAGEEDKPPPMLILILPAARSATDILPDPIGTDIFTDEKGDKRLVFFWTPENENAKRIKVEWTLEAVNPVDLESERIKINNRYLSIKNSDKESSSSLVETQSIGDQISRIRLLNVFYNSFTIDELREICFILAVDYQDIPGSAKRPKIFGLIEYFSRRGEIADLIEAISRERPKTAWRNYFLKAGYTI